MATVEGGRKLERALQDLARKVSNASILRVGFLEGATYPDGKQVAMIAAIQEYGAPRAGIPPRPFFRKMIADKSGEWPAAIKQLLIDNNYDARAALDKAGTEIEGQLRQSIIDMNSPPLSPVTLLLRQRFWSNPGKITFADVQQAREDVAEGKKAKVSAGQSKPLVWTGHLLNSISHEVKDK
jgi:hypothetical protein